MQGLYFLSELVNKIETTTWQYGSHTLYDEKGHSSYAFSSAVFDLDKFQNKMVIIFGRKIDGYPVDGGPIYLEVDYVQEIK